MLRRGVDRRRDQSYFLFALTQAQLARARFPVGDLEKAEVRDYARAPQLPVADKPESRDICFVPDGDYAGFVERRDAGAREADGAFVDAGGHELGRHGGVHRFTVGQRKGLGLSAPAPLYVLALDADGQRVTVGPKAALERTALEAGEVSWIAGAPPVAPRRALAQIRYQHAAAAGHADAAPGAAGRASTSTRRSRRSRRARPPSSTTATRSSAAAGSPEPRHRAGASSGKWCFEIVLRVDRGHAA